MLENEQIVSTVNDIYGAGMLIFQKGTVFFTTLSVIAVFNFFSYSSCSHLLESTRKHSEDTLTF